jgi:hypothetical protein
VGSPPLWLWALHWALLWVVWKIGLGLGTQQWALCDPWALSSTWICAWALGLLKDLVYHYRYISQKNEKKEEVNWEALWQKINLILSLLCVQGIGQGFTFINRGI